MTPWFKMQSNKTKLLTVFLSTVALVLLFQGLKNIQPGTAHKAIEKAQEATGLDEAAFMGLRHAPATEILAALPEASGKPMVLEFSSRLCHDCQRMKPVLAKLMPQQSNIFFKQMDVLEDKDKAPAIFQTFKPVSVPILVFIDAKGEIRNVLYNYQAPHVVAKALSGLQATDVATAEAPQPKQENK